MFDSTPLKTSRPSVQSEIAHATNVTRAASRRRSLKGPMARKDDNCIFDVLAVWDEEIGALREQVDIVSGWGPYELFECIPLFEGADGRQRVLCRFMYHGAKKDHFSPDAQAQFKYALLKCLRQITQWEDVAGRQHVKDEPE